MKTTASPSNEDGALRLMKTAVMPPNEVDALRLMKAALPPASAKRLHSGFHSYAKNPCSKSSSTRCRHSPGRRLMLSPAFIRRK